MLNELNTAIASNEVQTIAKLLTDIEQSGSKIELNDSTTFNKLLKHNSGRIQRLTAGVIAEWAKEKPHRTTFTNANTLNDLLNLVQSENEETALNSVRAIANICYSNPDASSLVDEKGLECIINVLKADKTRSNNTDLTVKTTGMLVNVLNTNDALAKVALKLGILPVLQTLLHRYRQLDNETSTAILYLVSVLSAVADYLDEENILAPEGLWIELIELFHKGNVSEVSVTIIEIFHGQAEKDEFKLLLAKQGVCQRLLTLIDQFLHKVVDEESRSILKLVLDLIVIILTGDDCMYLLYDNGKGEVYKKVIAWLDSDDSDLLSTGVLAIGNFARKDVHCIQMVSSGVSKKLIKLLSKCNTSSSDMKLQHALLSTLKNLVIPKQNKKQVLEEGLIDAMYPMIKIDQYLVTFKLLGTFRMVIDGQESTALDLISRTDFLEKLVYWCYNSDHLGVCGEVPRLLSWLIKNCHSFKPLPQFIAVKDTVKCLTEMVSSNHAVMQNEAFYALTLLCTGCKAADKEKLLLELIQAEFGKKIQFVVNRYGDKMDKQTVENLLGLLEKTVEAPQMLRHLKEAEVAEALRKLGNYPGETKERLDRILLGIDKT